MLNTYDRYGVTVVELDRGPVNAFDLELLGALTAAFDRADSPVVLTGASRTFSSGVDLRRSSSRIRATLCGVSASPWRKR